MTRKLTAGARLRRAFDAALEVGSQQLGKRLEWDEHEAESLRAACSCADRREQLQAAYDAELAGENRPGALVKLSAELRLLDKEVSSHLARVRVGPGVAKSERHQRAANSRWSRREAQGG